MAKLLLRWRQPSAAKRGLLRLSGGFRRIFVVALTATGVPTAAVGMAVWLLAWLAGKNVVSLSAALVLFGSLGAFCALFVAAVHAAMSSVEITSNEIKVGMKSWPVGSIQTYGWTSFSFESTQYDVLHLSVAQSSIQIALPTDLPRETVDRTLVALGLQQT